MTGGIGGTFGQALPRVGALPAPALVPAPVPAPAHAPAGNPFGRPVDSYLWGPLQAAVGAVSGGVSSLLDHVVRDERPTPDGAMISAPLDRAVDAQRALVDEHGMLGNASSFHGDGFKVWRTEAWPLGQVLHGRVAIAMQTGDWAGVDGIFREFEAYRDGDGFSGGIGVGGRYYDDNAWIGLAGMQAFSATRDPKYLDHARRTFEMVRTGQHPDGGLYWFEDKRDSRNTCSIAPAAELAMQLYSATGERQYLEFAEQQAAWLNDHLRMPDGLYADSLGDDGNLQKTVWSYNQGTPVGLDVQLYKATGDERYLARAKDSASAALRHYGTDDRLWQEPPVFNAIFLRNLMLLHSVSPDPAYLATIDSYLDRVWTQARDPATGLFDKAGIGHYEDKAGEVIDQGALSQLFAMRALPVERWGTLT